MLEIFFQTMLKKSEGGYVLFGKKPVCIHGFHVEDYFLQENNHHHTLVILREGALKWKGLQQNLKTENIFIHVYNKEDSLAKNYFHILFINKKLFIDTVQAHLILFQYVLGPEVTPEILFDKLTDPNQSFHSVLKNDKVLIGILLGFGPQNSLHVGRIEQVENSLFFTEQPPFKNELAKIGNLRPEFFQMLLFQNASGTQDSVTQASFGYSSLKEELEGLTKKIEVSSPQLSRQSPEFIFGRLKNDVETDKLVAELETTQNRINQLLASGHFLENVLLHMYPKEKFIIHPPSMKFLTLSEEEQAQLPFLVAANIWKIIKNEEKAYIKAFLEGMKACEKVTVQETIISDTSDYKKLKALLKIKNNLEMSDTYFQKLHNSEMNVCVHPFKLYYKIIKEGVGPTLDSQTNVWAHYIIKTPNDVVLSDKWMNGQAVEINLCETIPGFAWGLKNMKKGEIREIFIHPSLAYGIYTKLEKGIYLKAYVHLVDMEDGCDVDKFPELICLNLNADLGSSPILDLDLLLESEKAGYASGYQIWQHYKKNDAYALSQIISKISQFQAGMEADISSQANQDIINRLHWNIYHNAR